MAVSLSRRELGLLLRALDDGDPEADQALAKLPEPHDSARVFGFTGNPGAGKSTLVDGVIGELRSRDLTVGVLAVDPTSPFSGGAILGDRVRMVTHHQDEGVFIRSLATRGALGGLSRSTNRCIDALLRAGFDRVLVETVGVGQDEVEVVRAVDVNAVVCVPGLGDSVQAIKAGVLEIADFLVINKADRPGADALEKDLSASITLGEQPPHGPPEIMKTVATEFRGLAELVEAMERFFQQPSRSELLAERRQKRFHQRVRDCFEEIALKELYGRVDLPALMESSSPGTDPATLASQAFDLALCEGGSGVE